MQKKTTILILIIVIVLLLIGGVYWWWGNQQPKDVIPEGVKVEIQNGKKVIKNEQAGYEVEVPRGWSIYGENTEKLKISKTYKKFSPEVRVDGEIEIESFNLNNLSLQEQIANYHKDHGLEDYLSLEPITINNFEGYKGTYAGIDDTIFNIYYFQSQIKFYVISLYPTLRFPDEKTKKENKALIEEVNKDLENIMKSFLVGLVKAKYEQ